MQNRFLSFKKYRADKKLPQSTPEPCMRFAKDAIQINLFRVLGRSPAADASSRFGLLIVWLLPANS